MRATKTTASSHCQQGLYFWICPKTSHMIGIWRIKSYFVYYAVRHFCRSISQRQTNQTQGCLSSCEYWIPKNIKSLCGSKWKTSSVRWEEIQTRWDKYVFILKTHNRLCFTVFYQKTFPTPALIKTQSWINMYMSPARVSLVPPTNSSSTPSFQMFFVSGDIVEPRVLALSNTAVELLLHKVLICCSVKSQGPGWLSKLGR